MCTSFSYTYSVSSCSYAASKPPPTPSCHMKAWVELDQEELDKYFALRLLMGFQSKPKTRYYWSKDPKYFMPIFPNTMTRDRFEAVTRRLHFEDNANLSQEDRVWKLRTVVDMLNKRCREVYVPAQNITVDESLWAFRGRLSWVQYNPSKRARYGVKVYKLSASTGSASGYTSSFRIYTGQEKVGKKTNVSGKVVTDLLETAALFDKGYTMNVDNWYSSPDLFHYLQHRKTNAVGTVNMRRKHMPKEVDMALGKARGSTSRVATPTGMLCQQWVDRKVVTMLSTYHTSAMKTVSNRRGNDLSKPSCIVDYNNGMKGVDLSDQVSYLTFTVSLYSHIIFIYMFSYGIV